MKKVGRKPVPVDKKKIPFTIKIRKELVEKVREIENYNPKLEKLIEDFINSQK